MEATMIRIFQNPQVKTSFGDRLRELMCGLTGHDTMLRFQNDKLCLKCVTCGHESPGWLLNGTPPTRTYPAKQ